MGDKLHTEQECYFLSNREAFKQELVTEIHKQNEKQDKIITARIEKLEKEVKEGFSDLNNGWKRDLINQLVAALSGYKSNRQKIWLELIKLIGIICGAGGFAWALLK